MSKIARPAPDSKRPRKKSPTPLAKVAVAAPATRAEIRPVRRADLDAVIEIDAMVTGIEKRDYWKSLYQRYADAVATGQHFLVAVVHEQVIGFVIGEVRDWEFGSPPCGWVFAIDVRPDARLGGTATKLLEAICAGFKRAGVSKVRTMLSRDNTLILSFFRSQGMMIGPFIPLEMDLES
ncbi:MAG: GNAT family N-acetyltransferase [Rhodoferax sp.]|nr:GNAT family N-acetyltransferase [Rhodoferax sp.]MBK9235177.1 GNAT family N-acetyltransferase [Rhodoferax sp.]